MASLVDLETKINGMVDLSTAEIDKVFTEASGAAVDLTSLSSSDLDSFYRKFEEKCIELFEKAKIAGTAVSISDVKRESTSTGRLATAKGDALEAALNGVNTKMDDIETFIAGLKVDTDQADIGNALGDINTIKTADVRKEYFKRLTTKAVDEYGKIEESGDALSQGTAFIQFVGNSVRTYNASDVSLLIPDNDFIKNVSDEWKNNQAAKIGPNYKAIYDEEKRLKGVLGTDYDSTKPENAETQINNRINDLRDNGPVVDGIKVKYERSGDLSRNFERIVDNIDEFIEVASNEEIDDFINNIDEFKATLTGPSAATLSAKYDAAKTKAEEERTNRATVGHARHGHTGSDDAKLEADINTLLGDLPGLEAARDAAKTALDKETKRLALEQKDNISLEADKRSLEGLPNRTPEQDLELQVIDDILARRGSLDSSLQVSISDLEGKISSKLGTPPAFDISVEITNRNVLQDYLNLDLTDLQAITKGQIQALFPYSTTVSDAIWNNIQDEIMGRSNALTGNARNRKEKFADKNLQELKDLLDEVRRGDYDGRYKELVEFIPDREVHKHEVVGLIDATIRTREGMAQAWFDSSVLTAAGALNTADLNELNKIQKELDERKRTNPNLASDYTNAKDNVDAQNAKITAARNRRTIRGFADTIHTNLEARTRELDANRAERTRLQGLLGDAQNYDKQVKYKKALAQVMQDVENKFNGQKKVEEAAVENEVKNHPVFQTGDLSAHPNKDPLIQELTKELHKRVNKVKTATNSGTNKFKWGRAICGAVGLVTGLGLSCVPGVAPIMMHFALAKTVGNVVTKGINLWANKHPGGKVDNFINGRGGKISQFVKKCRDKLSGEGAKRANWFFNGVSIGYMAGNMIESLTDKTIAEHLFGSGDKTTVSVPGTGGDTLLEGVSEIALEDGVEYNLSGFKDVYYGPGYESPAAGLMDATAGSKVVLDTRASTMGVEGWRHLRFVKPDGTLGDYGWVKTGEVVEWLNNAVSTTTKVR